MLFKTIYVICYEAVPGFGENQTHKRPRESRSIAIIVLPFCKVESMKFSWLFEKMSEDNDKPIKWTTAN